MDPEGFSRQVDVSVVLSLASLLIILSAVFFMFDRRSARQSADAPGARALLWAHVLYLMAAAGLEIGRIAPFWFSATVVITGALGGLVAGYLAMEAALMQRWKGYGWFYAAAVLAASEGLLAYATGSLGLLFVTSSVANGSLAVWFAVDLYRRGRQIRFRPGWIMVLPFLGIAGGYFGRLGMITAGVPSEIVVVASTAIGVVFPIAAMCWVFSAMSVRSFHLNRDLQRMASLDALTGLENRASFDAFMNRLPDHERRHAGRRNICLCIDMDRFKEINDSFGHEAGDAVLVATARRLARLMRMPSDRIFRIGGDEFVFWHEADPADDGGLIADEVLRTLCVPVPHAGVELRVAASIGYAVTALDLPPRDVIRRADIALYRSKDLGRACVSGYSAELGAAYDARLAALSEFRAGLEGDQFHPVFQPQFDALTLEVTGCEVLARWTHPTKGTLGPQHFVPLAEELGLLGVLDGQMLDKALRAFHAWGAMGCPVPRISVNVSATRLSDSGLVEELARRDDLPRGALSFEILETALLRDDETLRWNVDRLTDLGIGIEVDDFGTGHASLASVVALEPVRIKIDRMFTIGIETDPRRRDLMAALIALVRRLDAEVVVEGVEHAAQMDVLRALGAAELQGFALAMPMDFAEMTAWLRTAPVRAAADRDRLRASGSE